MLRELFAKILHKIIDTFIRVFLSLF